MTMWTLLLLNFAREFFMDLLIACYYASFGHFILGIRQDWKRVFLACTINVLSHVITRHLLFTSVLSYLITAIDLYIICRILWHPRRGMRFFVPFLVCTISEILSEIIIVGIYILAYPDAGIPLEIAGHVHYALQPYTHLFLFALTAGCLCIVLYLQHWVQKLSKYPYKRGHAVLHILCFCISVALLLFVLTMFGMDFDQFLANHASSGLQAGDIREKLLIYALYIASALILCLYIWHDIRQFILFRTNRSLLEKNAAYQRIIENVRESGHNMANTLYGFEGVILTHDVEQIKAYYAEMARRYAHLNNKNAVALNTLKQSFLVSLLLRKFGDAEMKNVPFYLFVKENFSFDLLPSSVLCEVLGNLIDNALEAAERSKAPRVDVAMNCTADYDEIVISNTYDENADLSFLSGTPTSSKPNHHALGLTSVHRTLEKYPNIYFNQFISGRYIETSLCAYQQ